LDQLESFRAIAGAGDFVAFQFEQLEQQIEYFPVVIDDQDSAPV
jgi:hypothetical protein